MKYHHLGIPVLAASLLLAGFGAGAVARQAPAAYQAPPALGDGWQTADASELGMAEPRLAAGHGEGVPQAVPEVPGGLADERLDKDFLVGSDARGLLNLKGHRSVGGMRASIYNAVGLDAVEALVAYMAEFEKERG